MISFPSPARPRFAICFTLAGVAACTSSQAPTADEVQAALTNQLRNQGIPCDILAYSDLHISQTRMVSADVAQLDVDMNVALANTDFAPDCARYMSQGDGALQAERAVQRIILAYGERESMAYEWQLTNYELRLARDTQDHWQVTPAPPD